MPIELPQEIKDRLSELNNLVKEHPQYIPVTVAAKFIGANREGLREMIFKGQCPFGIAWQKDIKGNRVFKIPTIKFYMWFTNNAGV
ncbi:MAG: hypothetical protein A2Y15_08620 [Clostridiales bacterium GWF2_36_10]|nr:MAG: hypothetical protein A2Y15_08620 [Clostridiales bacterium GWF2_36_10]HAN20407.1 hypothetical protein [Clostridiales bacterium]